MSAITRLLALHVRDRYGIVSDAELRTLGVSVAQRRRLVEDELLVPVFVGVYRLASTPESLEGWCLAVSLADDRAVVTGRAAGRLVGLRRMGTAPTIEVRVPHYSNTLGAPPILLRRCNILDPEHVVTRPDGIRLVSPARLAFDLGAVLDDRDLESVVEQILDLEWCTMADLHRVAQRMYHPRRPGAKRFVRLVQGRPDWLKPADSDAEVLVFDALRRRGVTGLVRQHPIRLPSGITVHPDVAVPELRWAVEVDHVTWHGGRLDSQRDKQRDRALRRIDWAVERVTDDEVDHDLDGVIEELLELYERRRRSLAA